MIVRKLVIGTRGSALAMWQARWVADQLAARAPGLRVRLQIVKTAGDIASQAPLWEIGGGGLFVRELERALLDGRVDLAVHSMKDLPAATAGGLVVGAVPQRWDPRDVLISRHGLTLRELPASARVGTSSARRRAQLLAYRRDLEIVPLRGNVDTRLRKAESEDLDAIVLAAAGLVRLEKLGRVTEFLSPELCLPAVGQGALAVQLRGHDQEVADVVALLDHPPTRAATEAERAFLQALGGGCQVPVAALCVEVDGKLEMDGLVANPEGSKVMRARASARVDEAGELGIALFQQLESQGAAELLAEVEE